MQKTIYIVKIKSNYFLFIYCLERFYFELHVPFNFLRQYDKIQPPVLTKHYTEGGKSFRVGRNNIKSDTGLK